MKPFISAEEMARLEREAFDNGELLANVLFPIARLAPPIDPVVDEFGRAWRLPRDAAALNAMHCRYRQLHGRLSSAVDATFCEHGQLNMLRMLVLRCCEREAINLAHRALLLGPVPPSKRAPQWPADRPWPRDLIHARWRREVEIEDQRMRAAGYVE